MSRFRCWNGSESQLLDAIETSACRARPHGTEQRAVASSEQPHASVPVLPTLSAM